MTQVEIIKQFFDRFGSTRKIPYNSFVANNDKCADNHKDIIISLVANDVLKAKVDKKSMEIYLELGRKDKAIKMIKLQELADKLGVDGLKFRTISNEHELPSRPGKKYEDRNWERYVREISLAENKDGKFAILDKEGEPLFNDWFDNVCLVTYQSHPCYPERTVFGIVVEKNYEFAAVIGKGDPKPILRYNIDQLLKKGEAMLTVFSKRQFMFQRYDSDNAIYQAFWGYERTWARGEDELTVKYDENITYHENIMMGGNPYKPFGVKDDVPYEEWTKNYIPRYIYYKGQRKFFAYTIEELDEFLAEYEENKKKGDLIKYKEHYCI